MRTALALALLALAADARAGLDCDDLKCGWAEAWDIKGKAPVCAPAVPGTKDPQCVYDGDHAKDVAASFAKVHAVSGLPALKLDYWRDPKAHEDDCSGGGGMAVTDDAGKPVRMVICDNLFDSTRNIDQLAAVIGHELSHFIYKHADKENRACEKMLAAWKGRKSKKYLAETGAAVQRADAEKALCHRLNKISRVHERQADINGMRLSRKAGFKPAEAPKLYLQDRDLLWASSRKDDKTGRVVHGEREEATSHPTPTARAADLEAEAERLRERP